MVLFFKKILDKFQGFKSKIKKHPFYFLFRDYLFFREMKKEKKIEKQGNDAVIRYVEKYYLKHTGKKLNLSEPKCLTEKQQWIKLYDNSTLKTECTDKFLVRSYVERKIGSEYLVPLININGKTKFMNANEIDFDLLPNQFVIACNHGSSMTIVIKNKSLLRAKDIKVIKSKLNRWLKIEPAYINAFDYIYKDIKPCIMITKYLGNNEKETNDYKFMSFNGEPVFMWIDTSRFSGHKRTIFDLDFNHLDFKINNYKFDETLEKPANFDLMLELAKKLSKDFLFSRIDFYEFDGKVYFGEITLNSEGGVATFNPSQFDEKIGEKLILPLNKIIENK